MKTILYMAITADGFIAKADDSSDFLTPEESASYVEAVTQAGNLIIGRRTYEVLSQQPEFRKFKEAGVKIIVVSRTDFKTLNADEIVAHSPREALSHIGENDTVIVAGGGNLNGSFLKEDLIDELYLDIEPSLLGTGIPLFGGRTELETTLELIGSKQFSKNELQLHYKVVR